MSELTRNVFLIGFMGVGKTTVSRRLARDLGVASIDVDTYLQRKCGKDANHLYQTLGEAGLRALEAQALEECCAMGPAIISCGEGIVCASEARDILSQRGFVVLLESNAEASVDRIRSLRTRPLLAQGCNVDDLWQQRKPLYERTADAIVNMKDRGTAAAAGEVTRLLIERGIYLR